MANKEKHEQAHYLAGNEVIDTPITVMHTTKVIPTVTQPPHGRRSAVPYFKSFMRQRSDGGR